MTGNPRYLILNDIDTTTDAWGNFRADTNDIIEWTGTSWEIVLKAVDIEQVVYITNLRTGVQYKFENGDWTRAFEGEYQKGSWRIVL